MTSTTMSTEPSRGVTSLGAATTANRAIFIYLGALAAAGIVIIALTALRGWGGYGYGGGALLVLAGLGGMGGIAKQGGFGTVTCPACQHTGRIQFTKLHRTLQCGRCHTWLHGAETMSTVPSDHVAAKPTYWIELPKPVTLGHACLQCGAPATRRVKIEAVRGAATVAVVGVGVLTTTSLEVPACAAHDHPAELEHDPDATTKAAIGFHSLPAWRAFCDANQVGPTAPARHRLAPLAPLPVARAA